MDVEQEECTSCVDQEPAIAKCSECGLLLCEECARQHKRQKATTDHSIVENENAAKARQRYECKEHSLELNFYCCECKKPVCQHCTMKDCQGHKLDVAKDVRECLKASLDLLKTKAEDFESHVEYIQSVEQKNETESTRCEQDIASVFQEVIDQLLKRKEHLIADLKDMNGVQQSYIKEHKDFVEGKLRELKDNIKVIEKIHDARKDSKLMVERDHLLSKATELSQLQWNTGKVNSTQWQIVSPPKDDYARQFGQILPKPSPENIIVEMKENAVIGEQNEFTVRVEPKQQIMRCNIDKEMSIKIMLDSDNASGAASGRPQGTLVSRKVRKVSENEWKVSYFPRARGQLYISVSVCGVEAKDSFFTRQVVNNIKPGDKVVRGSDWKWNDQDGGCGAVGEVVTVKDNGWITVRWPNKKQAKEYRWGKDGKFDVKLYCE